MAEPLAETFVSLSASDIHPYGYGAVLDFMLDAPAGFDPATGIMKVELLGACKTCKSSSTTLKDLIERTTRFWIPEVSQVEEVKRKKFAKYADA